MKIIIPTRGRADVIGQKALRLFPDATLCVGATLRARPIAGMKYRMIDFNERVLAEGTVGADGLLKVPAGKPVWLTDLERP